MLGALIDGDLAPFERFRTSHLDAVALGLLHPSGNRLCGRLELARQFFRRASRSEKFDHLSPEVLRIGGSVTRLGHLKI